MELFKRLTGHSTKEVVAPDICLFSVAEKEVVDYTEKDSRADKITYRGIGSTKYGAGTPPAYYDSAISAVKSFPVVYGCVTAISEAIASLNVKVYEVKGGQRIEVQDHPFYAVFNRPNPYQGSYEFMEEVQQSLDVTGNAFIGVEKVAGTYELYLLPSKYVAIIPDAKTKVKMYLYYINGESVKYKPEEMIHIKYSDVDDPYYGYPPLSSATEMIKFETARLKYANQFFVNGAIPTGVLETEANIGDTLLKKLRNEWSNLHRGVLNSHKVAILQGGLKYHAISSPLKDLDFKSLKDIAKEDILTIYKVPESVLGNQGGTSSSEGTQALQAFWRGSIIPRIRRIESAMNRGLATQIFGDGTYEFAFNLKDVEALAEDKVKQSQYLRELVGSSILTINEARSIFGAAASTDPMAEMLLVSASFFGNQLLPLGEASALANAGGAGSNAVKPSVAPAPAAKPPTKPAAAKPTPAK